MRNLIVLALGFVLMSASSAVLAGDKGKVRGVGLNDQARQELIDAGANKYLGKFSPDSVHAIDGDWIRHQFTKNSQEGPLCINGSEYAVFTKGKDPTKLLIFLQGGGACWANFPFCSFSVDGIPVLGQSDQSPPQDVPTGIWRDDPSNPLSDYSIVYLPYCDGSVFIGDNQLPLNPETDVSYPLPLFPDGIRYHRGLQNLSAGIDVAKDFFPDAHRVVVAGSSAGGVGASAFAPLLVRLAYGDEQQLSVINDAGPVAVNLNGLGLLTAQIRAADWKFSQFYPESCEECKAVGQGTALIKWRLDNDSTIREAFYSTDGDSTNRGFLFVPDQTQYRQLLLSEHGELHEAYPARYKRFIVSGDDSHTALQLPRFYTATVDGVPLVDWVADFLKPGKRAYREKNRGQGPKKNSWVDLVEE
ncbi:pectin acetylesterase-family hydrolase [Lentisalinibacter sediminis]|uniref:pectin acetylesterase-family hydrolase n=1 Tax=Lentisalinibacter sediminis TaxID=2992237 RepID=UPI00386BD767